MKGDKTTLLVGLGEMSSAAGSSSGAGAGAANVGAAGNAASNEIAVTADLDEVLRRITDIKNIAGVVVVNSDGVTVKSTLDNTLTAMV